jgi:hypothetical protein
VKYLVLCIVLILVGCRTATAGKAAKWLLPANIGAAYFGTVAIHEGGHAATAAALGADTIKVDILPTRDRDGHLHLGLTRAYHDGSWSEGDLTLFRSMGPTASFLAHVSCREALKAGQVPLGLQSTLSWLSLFNQLSFYGHVFAGFARVGTTDLGQEDLWVSGVMLGAALTYDLYDIFDDGIESRVKVLFGEGFYGDDGGPTVKPIISPGFLGFSLDW